MAVSRGLLLSPETQIITPEFGDGPRTHQLHVTLDLGLHVGKGLFHAALACSGQGIQVPAPASAGFGPERQSLENMRASLDAAVTNNVDFIADRVDDFRELIERRP